MTSLRHRSAAARPPRARRGVALVTALALLSLAAALLAGSFASAASLAHAARAARASVYAEAAARRAAAEALASWPEGELLAVHAFVDLTPNVSALLGRTVARTRIQRISAHLYSITVDVRVGADGAPLAHRRARLVVERSGEPDAGGHHAAPTPVARWGVSDLY